MVYSVNCQGLQGAMRRVVQWLILWTWVRDKLRDIWAELFNGCSFSHRWSYRCELQFTGEPSTDVRTGRVPGEIDE